MNAEWGSVSMSLLIIHRSPFIVSRLADFFGILVCGGLPFL
jgi:hypothetical protein